MHAAYVLAALASAAAPRAADVPREPGVWWEQVSEVKGGAFQVPPQTTKVCLPKKQDFSRPPQQAQGGCEIEEARRSGAKLTWKVKCANGVSGEGEMVSSGDTYTGVTRMRTPGGAMTMNLRGRKLGGDCDANQYRRELAGMEGKQGELAGQLEAACDDALENMDAATLSAVPQCARQKGAFCARLGTPEGRRLVGEQGEDAERQAAAMCGGAAGRRGAAGR